MFYNCLRHCKLKRKQLDLNVFYLSAANEDVRLVQR